MIAPESVAQAVPETAEIALALAKLKEARELLARPTVESLENCQAQMTEIARVLEDLVAAGAPGTSSEYQRGPEYQSGPEFHSGLQEIRRLAGEIEEQIRHGSRFCLGWMQARLGVGYNQQGTPVMVESRLVYGEGRSFEI